jgi:tRNA(fMet)-specific endonuclease VapC
MFALDTNIFIYFLRDAGRVAERLRSIGPREIAIPSIVLYELEVASQHGKQSERRKKLIQSLVSVSTVLPFDEASAAAAAEARAHLEARGSPIGPLDFLIAGTAIAHRATLVTHNTSEFKRVPGLKIVDWY